MSDQYPNRLAQFVATELDRRGWGDREAGRRLKLHHVTIGNIISGATRGPDDATLDKLATLRESVDRETLRWWLRESPLVAAEGESVAAPRPLPAPNGDSAAVPSLARTDDLAGAIAARLRAEFAPMQLPHVLAGHPRQRRRLRPVEVADDALAPRLRKDWIAWVNPSGQIAPGDVVLLTGDGPPRFKVYESGNEVAGVVELVQHEP